jgi:parvulin-like peptidyl-prolyl isomerase
MVRTPWLRFGDHILHLEELPSLLERTQLLKPLFRRLLLEQCMVGIELTAEDQIAFQQRFLARKGIDSAEKLSQWLAELQISEDQASINIAETLRLERFKELRFGSEVNQIFLATKGDRDRVVYSLLRVQEQAAAEELFLRLEEEDSTFTDLAGEHSQGSERDTGGLIGPVSLGRLHPHLAELLRISQPGQLWRPIELDGWWVVVRLDKRLPAQLDAAMQQQIRDELFEYWLQAQMDALLSAYSGAPIQAGIDHDSAVSADDQSI